MAGKSRKQREAEEVLRIALAETIRTKAVCIGRADQLGAVTSGDIKGIKMLPWNRVFCTACGVPLYVDEEKKAIQIADSMPTSGSSGCRHVNGAVSRRPETR